MNLYIIQVDPIPGNNLDRVKDYGELDDTIERVINRAFRSVDIYFDLVDGFAYCGSDWVRAMAISPWNGENANEIMKGLSQTLRGFVIQLVCDPLSEFSNKRFDKWKRIACNGKTVDISTDNWAQATLDLTFEGAESFLEEVKNETE